jgi:ribosome biogenesis GTPase
MAAPRLHELGFDARLEEAFAALGRPELVPGRVVLQYRKSWLVATADQDVSAELPGRVRRASDTEDLPTVGDFVALEPAGAGPARLIAVLPRKGALVRHAAGVITTPQVLVANLDVLFLVSGLDRDFNPRRIERFLTVALQSGAAPVIVLNKIDICPDVDDCVTEASLVAQGAPVLTTSARHKRGLESLRPYLGPGRTAAFVGSSGVGKSTLVNALLGEERMATGEVRTNDQRGRHVTTRRELVVLPDGQGCLIDTPGLREVQLWGDEAALSAAFADVETLAAQCRFGDCSHEREPGCAVREALDAGTLDELRWDSYRNLQRELASLRVRTREHEARAAGRRLSKAVRQVERLKKPTE